MSFPIKCIEFHIYFSLLKFIKFISRIVLTLILTDVMSNSTDVSAITET